MRFFSKISLLALLLCCNIVVFAQKEYYTSINGVKGGATLKDAIYNLVKNHKKISYGSGTDKTWGAFYTTDRDPATNKVYDMYSSEVRYFGSKGSAIGGMNIEHSVAKSWWGSTQNNAYCDLHHLNPSDQTANSRKSNYPLAELESVSWENGVTFVGKATINGSSINAYEPCDEYKGDFARTFMYMFTCYQDLTYEYTWMNYESSTYPTFKPWAVELLLKWHKQDPVSEKEINRNNAVYAVQGNRNPYVDFPQLAEYVWGDSVNYVFNLDGAVIGGGDTGGGTGDVAGDGYLINESFSASLGNFTTYNALGDYTWTTKYSSAYVTAYVSSVNNAAESWLISPSVDLTAMDSVYISFDYVTKYNETGKVAECNQLLVSSDYSGDVSAATWTVVDFSAVENSSDWTFTNTGKISMPQAFMGKKNVTLAFKYTSTTSKAGTWEVKNLLVEGVEGNATGGDDNTGDGGNTGDDNTGNNGNYQAGNFRLVTDAANLTVGDSLIITYSTFVMGESSSNGNFRTSIENGAVFENDEIKSYPAGTQIVVLAEGTKEGSFALKVGDLYLAAVSSSSNYLRSVDSVTDAASWVITIGSEGAADLVSQGSFTRNTLQYNTSSPRFSCYKSGQKPVNLYAKSPKSDVAAGDSNGDGVVDVADVTMIVSIILGTSEDVDTADVNGDGNVDVADVTTIIEIILSTTEQ